MTMMVSLLALGVALLALASSRTSRHPKARVQIEISRSSYFDAEGKERGAYSFSHGHPKTVFDRFRIVRARRRFDRLSRDDCGVG
ncbi:hypothetical protein [Paraburkholderia tropica]|uniref:hypothetical protein n=1 Tax=Paraburkholderia tropica TaxID=92647 RepID=UPI003D2BB521